MNTLSARELRHGSLTLAALLLPALLLIGCESGVSGHGPGLAGVQTQDPGTLNFPLAYIKRPAPATPKDDIDARDLITSTTGGDLYIREQASPDLPRPTSPSPSPKEWATCAISTYRPTARSWCSR